MDPVLLGRDVPLAALRDALDEAFAGRGGLAVVSGEAGIGKSALAAALAREAESRGARVTWGRAWEFADAPPYFPVWPCLRALGIDVDHAGRDARDDAYAFQLWERVLSALARASSNAPAVWMLEDMHAADLGTLDLLTFLAQPLRAMRVLVVATLREKDPRLTARMTQRLTRIARDGLDLRLELLSERDVGALTQATIGRAVSATALRRLAELTGGNPLFVVECARAFRAAGGVEETIGSLPPTVRQVVLDRVALLPEATRHTLANGSILGREFSAASVARMEGSLPARVIDVLLPALRAGIVDETRPGHFIFSHTLVRDAIDDALGAEQRATIHGRADAALAALGDTADVLVERARHALAALPSSDAAHTIAIADRAADLLEREGAFDRAYELHVRIGEARAAGFLTPAPAARLLHVARIAREAGRSDASRRMCEDVIAIARTHHDAELFARAALLHAKDVRPGVVDRSQIALLEEALAQLGDRAAPLACIVLARLSAALVPAIDTSGPLEMAREAVRRAKATNDDAVVLDVLDLAGWPLVSYPSIEERVATANDLLERALRANDLRRALTAREWLAMAVDTGDFDAFDRNVDGMLALSDELGHPRHRWRPLLYASARATTLGRFTESDRWVTEAAQIAPLADDAIAVLALAAHDLVRLRVQRRDPELPAAMARLRAASESAWEGPLLASITCASVLARVGDVEATRAELASIGGRARQFEWHMSLVACMAEANALAGTDDERRHSREILARAPAKDISGGMPHMYEGTTPRLLGLLDASLGDLVTAEANLREARALAITRKHAPWIAQTSFELSKVLARIGRHDEARTLAEESSAIARELGMTGLLGSASTQTTASVVAVAREGAVWTIARGSDVVRVKDSRGMQLLARLVERPGEDVHVLALASDDASASIVETNAGDAVDDRARRAYSQRLADLDDDISEAERNADPRRVTKLQHEKDMLRAELARSTGLGGRARQAGSATERARVNVQRRVKDAIARISEVDAGLGRFFERAVSTGTFCCFRP